MRENLLLHGARAKFGFVSSRISRIAARSSAERCPKSAASTGAKSICRFWASTLAHPLARVVARYTWLGAYLLERVPWLRTHDLAAIRPTGDAT